MTTDAPTPQPEQIMVNFDDVMARFAAENSALLRRAILAEAQVQALQVQNEMQRRAIEAQNAAPAASETA